MDEEILKLRYENMQLTQDSIATSMRLNNELSQKSFYLKQVENERSIIMKENEE